MGFHVIQGSEQSPMGSDVRDVESPTGEKDLILNFPTC